MKLDEVLWATVLWLCVLFYAFAAGVAVGEWEQEPEPVPVEYEVAMPVMAGTEERIATACGLAMTAEPAQEPQLDVCEDTYLRDDIPLSYELQMLLYGACLDYEIEYPLALAMIEQETQFKNIKGDGGKAYGYFQVWPKWHKDRMAQLGVSDLMDPEGNFRVALHFMRENLDKYGSLEDALSFYNTGAPGQTKYSREVMERMGKYEPDLR